MTSTEIANVVWIETSLILKNVLRERHPEVHIEAVESTHGFSIRAETNNSFTLDVLRQEVSLILDTIHETVEVKIRGKRE